LKKLKKRKEKACNYSMGKFNEFIDYKEIEEIEEHPLFTGYMNLAVKIGMIVDLEE
jgi:hypothetical protein